jgi:DNA ligase-associated metallophosphoesterase
LSAPVRFIFEQQTLWLSPARCIFWEEENALILSDLHFGKSGHFRKSGIGIPQHIFREDLQRLFSQIRFFNPRTLLIAGDMFHSTENREMDFFLKWRRDFPAVEFNLIRGNHDILEPEFYRRADIRIIENKLNIRCFSFTHDMTSTDREEAFTFSGHIHPGVRMNGAGNQSLMLPCFYFGKKHAVLPAFSAFTGLARIRPVKTDHVFVLAGHTVIQMQ